MHTSGPREGIFKRHLCGHLITTLRLVKNPASAHCTKFAWRHSVPAHRTIFSWRHLAPAYRTKSFLMSPCQAHCHYLYGGMQGCHAHRRGPMHIRTYVRTYVRVLRTVAMSPIMRGARAWSRFRYVGEVVQGGRGMVWREPVGGETSEIWMACWF